MNSILLDLIDKFLHNRCQRVVVHGQKSWDSTGICIRTLIFSHLYLMSTHICWDLLKIQDWTYKWKISFSTNQDIKLYKVQEVLFSRKTNKIVYPSLYFNNANVKLTHTQTDHNLARQQNVIQCTYKQQNQ